MARDELADLLLIHEGIRLKPYKDSVGKLTIGIGRNLEDTGISCDEAILMLRNDILKAEKEASKLPWFAGLNKARQDVIINMIFNMGMTRFLGFKEAIKYLEAGDYVRAAREMRDSWWAKQVGRRAENLSRMMIRGAYLLEEELKMK